MGKIILKPSTIAYDGMNSVGEIVGEYQAYLKLLSTPDLKTEYQNAKRKMLNCPSVYNVHRFEKAKERMINLGLSSDGFVVSGFSNNEREM